MSKWMNPVLTVHFFTCSSRCSLFLRSSAYSSQLRATSPPHDSTSYARSLTQRLMSPRTATAVSLTNDHDAADPRSIVVLALHRPLRISWASVCVFRTTLYHHHAPALSQTCPAVLSSGPSYGARHRSITRLVCSRTCSRTMALRQHSQSRSSTTTCSGSSSQSVAITFAVLRFGSALPSSSQSLAASVTPCSSTVSVTEPALVIHRECDHIPFL